MDLYVAHHSSYSSSSSISSSSSSSSMSSMSPSPASTEHYRGMVKQSPQRPHGSYYRRKEIVDGSVVRIVETRRRPSRYDAAQVLSAQKGAWSDEVVDRIAATTLSPGLDDRQNVRCMSRDSSSQSRRLLPQTRPIIMQSSESFGRLGVSDGQAEVKYKEQDQSSPPPTPRPKRLATPDLPELKQSVFCDCCPCSQKIPRCTKCGYEKRCRCL